MTVRLPWWDRLNNLLRPYIGPPPLGPYDQAPEVHPTGCPICGMPMAEHVVERTDNRPTRLHCPTPA